MTFAGRSSLISLLLATPGIMAQGESMPLLPSVPGRTLRALEITGGSKDDQTYASAASGLEVGKPVGEESFLLALTAMRATDRFRAVQGTLVEGPLGLVANVNLEPWPAIKARVIRGTLPRALRKGLFTGMHKGGRAGDLRIHRWQTEAEQRLQEAGYPEAKVRIDREEAGARLAIQIDLGTPALIQSLEVEGEPAPYTVERIKGLAEVKPGKSLWTTNLQREVSERLRRRLVKDHRFEGTAECFWDEATGNLRLRVEPGPWIVIRQEGEWSFWWKKFEDLVPLARAGRYSPELLDEGDRRILRYLRDMGFLDAQVSHRRDVLRDQPLEVAITFTVQPGLKTHIRDLQFERNKDIPETELKKAAALPSGIWFLGDPPATPELIGTVEDRIKTLYWSRGYPDVALRRPPMERAGGTTTLIFQVREGTRQTLDKIILEMPSDPSWQPWEVAESIPLVFTGKLIRDLEPDASSRVYRSDRAALKGVTGHLQEGLDPARPEIRIFTFTTSQALPFVKNDLALVYSALRQRLSSLGVQRPLPRLSLEPGEAGYVVHLTVPNQTRVKVNRLVVQGADYTKARAFFRETQLEPGSPLDLDRLSKAQTQLGNLGAFQRVDLMNLGQAPAEGESLPWKEGDLFLRADERAPWVLSSSFGYDKSHGYHVGAGAQRLNFLGMGRTLDFGVRAGDTTLRIPALRKLFPTGEFDRSVDSFSVGYTDPWFLPGGLKNLLSDRVQYRAEAAYIEETQAAFLAHRRRVQNSFEWKAGEFQTLRLGHRYERTEIKGNVNGIRKDELFNMAGVPGPVTILSAPFFQFTRDKRDHPIDPKRGTFFQGRLEMANQLFGTGAKYSFVKLDVRHQWNWSFGEQASRGVLMAAARFGVARPTAATVDDLPLTERFFAGGPYTVRGVEPDMLGPVGTLGLYKYVGGTAVQTGTRMIPLGGQGLVVLNLEYRFPLLGSQTVWGEFFVDSGQVYAKLNPKSRQAGDPAPFPPLRTTLGLGIILKIGLPLKLEYATDVKRILGQPRTQQERDTQLQGLLISAGYQF